MIDVDFPEILTPVFDNLSQSIYDAIVMYGGRGGAKSEALTALGIMESYIDDGVILCCREIQKSISDSIYGSLVSFIGDKNLSNDFKILNNEITNLRTGSGGSGRRDRWCCRPDARSRGDGLSDRFRSGRACR